MRNEPAVHEIVGDVLNSRAGVVELVGPHQPTGGENLRCRRALAVAVPERLGRVTAPRPGTPHHSSASVQSFWNVLSCDRSRSVAWIGPIRLIGL